MIKRAFQLGAGNIGRGFLGQLFFESGYNTTFIDVVTDVIEGLNTRHEYPLRIVGDNTETRIIGNASAVHAGDIQAAARVIADADVGATAVGVPVLPKIAPLLAAGIAERFQRPDAAPLDIIVCENMINAEPFMREEVRKHLAPEYHTALNEKVGFVEASIGRMVPVMTEKERAEDPLLVCVEPYCELPVDAKGFKGLVPELVHMKPMSNFSAYVERKLYIHNMSHATAAYLGYLRKHTYIWEAVADTVVRTEVERALEESCAGMHAKHGLDIEALREHGHDLLYRYSNKALGDQVARIAKDPIRKLGPNDRLIGACLMCKEQGVTPRNIALGVAAALHYEHPDDPASLIIQEKIRSAGVDTVLNEICGLDPQGDVAQLVKEGITRLIDEEWVK